MEMYTFTNEQLEDFIDKTKLAFMGALVYEKLIDDEVADKWCASHTLILRKRSFFRTLSDKWFKARSEHDKLGLVIVKKAIDPEREIEESEDCPTKT